MRRRGVTIAFAGALVSRPSVLSAQPDGRARTVAFLNINPRPPDAALAKHALIRGLGAHGYVQGRNLIVIWHFAGGDVERLTLLAAELARSPAKVIVAAGGSAASAMVRATSQRPVVIFATGDPVGVGLVDSLARPGRNVTGVSEASTELSAKRMDLLRQLVPNAARIAVVWNANDQGMTLRYRAIEQAGRALGVKVEPHGLRSALDIDPALQVMAANPPGAMLVVSDSLTRGSRRRFLDFEIRYRVPAMYEFADYVRDGGLIAYGPSIEDQTLRAAYYVARILGGARPADLPLEQPTRFYLTVNQRTAKALGIDVPALLVTMADEVIE